ncbi:chordin-like protein 2 isoform X2 [Montipora foliosa]|uniref:chordin-like protein 2 isoform X2 n=1 Tax=Montipora foliosa TaxID=591990 RepID=UPI0035F1BF89
MIALSVAELKTFTPESEISFGIKQKKNVFVESLDHFRSLEIREKNKQEDSCINMRLGGIAVAFYFVAFFVASECRFLFKDFAPKETRTRRSATCRSGIILYHNVTTPVDSASCTECRCSGGNISNCRFYECDVGQDSAQLNACEKWEVGKPGVCCPKCVCFHAGKLMKSGDSWARTLASGKCYDCTCKGSIVDCSLVGCPGCPHGILKEHVPGKCCPQCRPEPTSPAFTIPSPFRLHDNKK